MYWWGESTLTLFETHPLMGSVSPARAAQSMGDNPRFCRNCWEVQRPCLPKTFGPPPTEARWVPFINGASGTKWMEPLRELVRWDHRALHVKLSKTHKTGRDSFRLASEDYFFGRGVAIATIGQRFLSRLHVYPSVFCNASSSLFPESVQGTVCALMTDRACSIVQSLNPSVNFEVSEVNRLPRFQVRDAESICGLLQAAFGVHESRREPSVEFRHPGPSPWRRAQEWAQLAVDRPEGEPLPDYVEELDPEPATDHLSYALGVALGRFSPNGEGVLDPAHADLSHALPGGMLFLDRTLDGVGTDKEHDSLFLSACQPLHDAWAAHAEQIRTIRRNLRDWLALDFFSTVHKGMYENRPIHWPLSSSEKTFVAWVNIHRFTDGTLRLLLADHLVPRLAQIEGTLTDLRAARDGADRAAVSDAERQITKLIKARDELATFIKNVETCADRGPLPTDAACPAREQDRRYAPDLDDGVMINSAALWPLLEQQWRDPKKWWKELAKAQGRKDYDWAHLAMRYWPTRVDAKCQEDPSLAVAHGCFWRYHPARVWAWELRLQHEIGPDFRITEAPYTPGGRDVGDEGDAPHRKAWLQGHMNEALAAIEKEAERRQGRARRRVTVSEMNILESGLWTVMPAEVWRMEIRLSERQGAEFRLVSPDEPEQRTAYVKANPELARARASALAQLKPVAEMFAEEDEEEDEAAGLDADDDSPANEEDDSDD